MVHIYQAVSVTPGAADWRRLDNVKNTVAAGPPTVTDDETDGHETFSRWLDTTGAPDLYECLDPITDAAVWIKLHPRIGVVGTVSGGFANMLMLMGG